MTEIKRIDNEHGRIGNEIRRGVDDDNKPWVNFSLSTDVRRLNDNGEWQTTGTRWRQVHAHGALAKNVGESFEPGDAIVVSGSVETEARLLTVEGQPQVVTRDDVRADMIAPDLRFTPVHFRHRKGEEIRPAVVQDASAQAENRQAAPADQRQAAPASEAGFSDPGPDTAAPRALGQEAYANPVAGGGNGWPPVTEPGNGNHSTPY